MTAEVYVGTGKVDGDGFLVDAKDPNKQNATGVYTAPMVRLPSQQRFEPAVIHLRAESIWLLSIFGLGLRSFLERSNCPGLCRMGLVEHRLAVSANLFDNVNPNSVRAVAFSCLNPVAPQSGPSPQVP